MSTPCPTDNSNDAIACLLREISSHTQPNWNWDPLNFAITAAIGLLALIIACITVFQGLLAAGPGRLKASNLAIGPFSIHSRSRFDRTELALRTTARVPLITWDVVYHRVVRQKFRPNFESPGQHHGRRPITPGGWADDDKFYDGITTLGTTSVRERHQYDSTATWLTLLTALGLDDPQFFPLVQRVTDYLPADIQAAPAAAELRCLAILAVIADSNAIIESAGPNSRFVTVSADSSQLGFRDHPSLGAVAAYEAYEETAMLKVGKSAPLQFGTQFPVLRFDELDRCLQLASGRLAYADGRIPPSIDEQADERGFMTLVTDLRKRSEDCGHEICENAMEDWNTALRSIGERKKGWKLLGALKGVYMAISLLAAERANLCRGFPKEKMGLQKALADVVGLDEFWATELTFAKIMHLQKTACSTFWSTLFIPDGERLSASWVVDFKGVQSSVRNPFTSGMSSTQRQHFNEDKTLALMQTVRAFVARQTDPGDASLQEIEDRKLSSQSLAQLMVCLDGWLLRKGGASASCCMLKMLYRLGSQAQVLTTNRADFEQQNVLVNMGKDFQKSCGGGIGYSRTRHADEILAKLVGTCDLKSIGLDMSTLLVLRGILMGLLLDSGADTSLLYHPEFRDSVVKVL